MNTYDDSSLIRYSLDGHPPSQAVIQDISVASNNKPTSCPPLHNAIDTDALDALYADMNDGKIRFDYAGYYVMINSDNTIIISPH